MWKNEKFALTKKIRQINHLEISLANTLFSRNFSQKRARVYFRNFHTVQQFAATQILREITYADFRISKIAILISVIALNFHFWEFWPFQMRNSLKEIQISASKIVKFAVLDSLEFANVISHKI